MILSEKPHWEYGFRCHGYWIGNTQWGFVGIPPRPSRASVEGYGWSFHPHGVVPNQGEIRGQTRTLREAKKAVEAEYRKWCLRVGK